MNKAMVMIVDDELDFANTLASRLRLRGYETHVVLSPDQTIKIAESLRPDVVLLDLRLPGISGVEILMTIRQHCPGTEVILLTGHLNLEQTIEGVRLDSFHCILKPFDITELVEKIDSVRKAND
jgi:DNA-binding response OmpR family regulator